MPSGRKREFDEKEALSAAMETFWNKGYAGASLSDLTKSMGINKPSMYSVFGNKEALFIKATQLYIEEQAKSYLKILYENDVSFQVRIKSYLMSIVTAQSATDNPKGCYIVLCQSEIAGGDMPDEASRLLKNADSYLMDTFIELFNTDVESKSLGLNVNAKRNALCIATTLKGTAAMARLGVSLAELEYTIDNCLKGLHI